MQKEISDILKEELTRATYNPIRDEELLTKLILEAKAGSLKSRDLVTNSFLRMVYDISVRAYEKQKPRYAVPFDDFFQAGSMGLLKSFKTFDHTKGKFSTHAYGYINGGSGEDGAGIKAMYQADRLDIRINHMVRNSKDPYTKQKSDILINRINPFSSEESPSSYSWLESGSMQPDRVMEISEAQFTADEIMAKAGLSDLERDAFFGAHKGVSETIEDLYHVAEIYKISHEGARKAFIRAQNKIKEVRGQLV